MLSVCTLPALPSRFELSPMLSSFSSRLRCDRRANADKDSSPIKTLRSNPFFSRGLLEFSLKDRLSRFLKKETGMAPCCGSFSRTWMTKKRGEGERCPYLPRNSDSNSEYIVFPSTEIAIQGFRFIVFCFWNTLFPQSTTTLHSGTRIFLFPFLVSAGSEQYPSVAYLFI